MGVSALVLVQVAREAVDQVELPLIVSRALSHRLQRFPLRRFATRIVFDDDGVKDHGHRGRGGNCPRDRECRQVGAEQVEVLLHEREAHSVGKVGRVDDDERAAVLDHVGERRPVKHVLFVNFDRPFSAAGAPEPVERIEKRGLQCALDIAPEKDRLEVVEDTLAVQAVVGGREAPAGDGRDAVDLVQQSHRTSLGRELDIAQRLEDPVRESSGARAPARKREEHLNVIQPRILTPCLERVALGRRRGPERQVFYDPVGGAAGDEHQQKNRTPSQAKHASLPQWLASMMLCAWSRRYSAPVRLTGKISGTFLRLSYSPQAYSASKNCSIFLRIA